MEKASWFAVLYLDALINPSNDFHIPGICYNGRADTAEVN